MLQSIVCDYDSGQNVHCVIQTKNCVIKYLITAEMSILQNAV